MTLQDLLDALADNQAGLDSGLWVVTGRTQTGSLVTSPVEELRVIRTARSMELLLVPSVGTVTMTVRVES